ncbi:GxxExxY protein [Phnomibacter sp. MR]|uniref:GxxExxY protein n=1 Tax=Phnomibacter sp. MR TaxID=3042318 RepID=UPI003A800541
MLLHESITQEIIGSFYKVHNSLGFGFLEKVYENAMVIELEKSGLSVQRQHKIDVYYDEKMVGVYYADLLIEGKVIVELKACSILMPEHEAQLLNYLKATNIEVGLLLNFGLEPSFKRKVFSNLQK